MSRPSATAPIAPLVALACALGGGACDRAARAAVEPVPVAAVEDSAVLDLAIDDDLVDDSATGDDDGAPDDTARASDDATTADADAIAVGAGGGGGLRVLAADGALVGYLVGRGDAMQSNGAIDPLRDGVIVYNPSAQLFFGVAMASGKVIVPRLGIADSNCNQPIVAGYYADGPEISGFDYGFAWKGSWYVIEGGKPLQLVGCAGVVTGGDTPKCVPHGGSCRGFPVKSVQSGLPMVFAKPLRFDWNGAGG